MFGQGDTFGHPHNAYLQWMLDNGLLGMIVIGLFYFYIMRYSFSLFRDSRDVMFVAVGGMCFSLVGALLIASMSGQSFYPRESSIAMWCGIGLMLRVYVERSKYYAAAKPHTHHETDGNNQGNFASNLGAVPNNDG
jgi:O-antigen ligase